MPYKVQLKQYLASLVIFHKYSPIPMVKGFSLKLKGNLYTSYNIIMSSLAFCNSQHTYISSLLLSDRCIGTTQQ